MTDRRRTDALQATDGRALLVTAQPNVRYLTGFTGSNGQVLLCPDPVFLTDGRYEEQSAEQVPDLERHIYSGSLPFTDLLRKACQERDITTLAVEADHLTLAERDRFADKLAGIELTASSGVVEGVRASKDSAEIAAIERAQRIAEQAVTSTLDSFTSGTERELALELEWAIRTSGGTAVSFEVIAATGAQSALPHAEPRDVPADLDGVLLIDIGAVADGYCSDMTRTYLGPAAPDELRQAHAAVVGAVEAACAAVKGGVSCVDVDAAARGVLEEAGLAERFVHSTGHGVGLDIHEDPSLAPTSEATLTEGMVITIEPGVYLPGVGGIRVEDLLVVTADGFTNLTTLDRGPDR